MYSGQNKVGSKVKIRMAVKVNLDILCVQDQTTTKSVPVLRYALLFGHAWKLHLFMVKFPLEIK